MTGNGTTTPAVPALGNGTTPPASAAPPPGTETTPGAAVPAPRTPPGRALVLGGSGFVGGHVCDAFASAGYEVVAVARTPRPEIRASRTVAMDLLAATPGELAALLGSVRPTVVVNATGAVWGVSPQQMADVNVRLVRVLVDALSLLDQPPRLIQLGSVHEYGPVPQGVAIDENLPELPATEYGRTKLLGTRLVLDAARDGRLEGVVLRISNVVGPGTPRGSLLGRVAGQLSEAADAGRPALLRLAPLRARRDFVDVRDITGALVAAAVRPVSGRLLNLGRGEAVDVRWLVDTLIAVSGIEADLVEEGSEEARSAGVEWQQVDCGAAHTALGWRPARRLEDSLRALWEETRACRVSRAS